MWKASLLALLLLLSSGCSSHSEHAMPAAAKELVATPVHSTVSTQQVAGQTRAGSATLLVAAAASSTAVKRRANYICDGQDDHLQIQAAIDALSNQTGARFDVSGGVVELSAGAFHLGAAIHCRDKVVSLIGAGMGSSELALQDGVNDDILVVGTGTKQGWQSGRIAHLSLNGNGEAQARGSGIRVLAGLRLAIEDVHVYDCKETGIFLQGLSAVVRPAIGTIENCHIGYNQKHGIHIGAGIEGWIIRGNRINDNGTHGQPYHGVYIEAIHGKVESGPAGAANAFIIANNVLWQNRAVQICINGGGHGGAHIVITGNVILSSPLENIKLSAGTHLVSITGNSIHSASESQIGAAPHITLENASHCTISANVFSSPSRGLPSPAMIAAGAEPGKVVPVPGPAGILIEKGSANHNRFIGNTIAGEVTDVILVGANSASDHEVTDRATGNQQPDSPQK
ncbi:MAG: right-handed parallel beta-helix repeat-containing protein [Planctomycetota bacterium]|nr:right-handed parallel beta-helix repeat-containing protein [Planctomycetota bacterium]